MIYNISIELNRRGVFYADRAGEAGIDAIAPALITIQPSWALSNLTSRYIIRPFRD